MIVFPSEEDIEDEIWMIYVEGVDCITCERFHPEFSRDTKQYDNKPNECGITYELGTHIFQDSVIWMNGPLKYGGNNYKGDFVEHSLRDNLK